MVCRKKIPLHHVGTDLKSSHSINQLSRKKMSDTAGIVGILCAATIFVFMCIALALFINNIKFRSDTFLRMWILEIFVVVQMISLLLGHLEPHNAMNWVFWGAEVCGFAPWALIYTHATFKAYEWRPFRVIGLQVFVLSLLALFFMLQMLGLFPTDSDVMFDTLSALFVSIACLPSCIVTINATFNPVLRPRFAKYRDVLLSNSVCFIFLTFIIHRGSSDVREGWLIVFFLLQPLMFLRVFLAVANDKTTVEDHPERHFFTTINELAMIPGGLETFFQVLTERDNANVALCTHALLWSRNEEWLKARLANCPSREYEALRIKVSELMFKGDIEATSRLSPLNVRIDCIRMSGRLYQNELRKWAVQKALSNAFRSRSLRANDAYVLDDPNGQLLDVISPEDDHDSIDELQSVSQSESENDSESEIVYVDLKDIHEIN